MDQQDRAYFYRRAETELELAQRATNPAAVKTHYLIANEYLERAYANGQPPLLKEQEEAA